MLSVIMLHDYIDLFIYSELLNFASSALFYSAYDFIYTNHLFQVTLPLILMT